MRAIAAEAGVSVGSVYYYLASRHLRGTLNDLMSLINELNTIQG